MTNDGIPNEARTTNGEARGMVRLVDESGGDYLFPADMFLPIKVPAAVSHACAQAS